MDKASIATPDWSVIENSAERHAKTAARRVMEIRMGHGKEAASGAWAAYCRSMISAAVVAGTSNDDLAKALADGVTNYGASGSAAGILKKALELVEADEAALFGGEKW